LFACAICALIVVNRFEFSLALAVLKEIVAEKFLQSVSIHHVEFVFFLLVIELIHIKFGHQAAACALYILIIGVEGVREMVFLHEQWLLLYFVFNFITVDCEHVLKLYSVQIFDTRPIIKRHTRRILLYLVLRLFIITEVVPSVHLIHRLQ